MLHYYQSKRFRILRLTNLMTLMCHTQSASPSHVFDSDGCPRTESPQLPILYNKSLRVLVYLYLKFQRKSHCQSSTPSLPTTKHCMLTQHMPVRLFLGLVVTYWYQIMTQPQCTARPIRMYRLVPTDPNFPTKAILRSHLTRGL